MPHKVFITYARKLRRNSTDAEKRIWHFLRNRRCGGHRFFRQYIFDDTYILDFYCAEKKLVVEVDGGQHSGCVSDKVRDSYLTRRGCKIIRLWNNDVLTNTPGCLETISDMLK
ncbi:MAG: endonuclease domain-containing protein [Alphaproteobacteria bacterium]|nr:endonuclease domain-containing protein [Alphaproteobacteria bacterium]